MSVLNKIRPNYLNFRNVTKRLLCFIQKRNCYSIFGIKDLVQHEKPESFSIVPVQSSNHETAVRMAKRYFLTEHVFVRARRMELNNDRAIDEYIIGLLKQGNSLFAKTANDTIAGFCINFAASPVDPQNLRNYAYYRQDPNTKDFLNYTAKLQETPNLWNIFKEDKVFEIKMLAVIPEYRRQGLATMLAQKSKSQAKDQGYKVIRMDCINPYEGSPKYWASVARSLLQNLEAPTHISCLTYIEQYKNTIASTRRYRKSYKIAERCMLSCLVKFPLHKLRGANAPFVKKSSELNTSVRVFVEAPATQDSPNMKQIDLESMFE